MKTKTNAPVKNTPATHAVAVRAYVLNMIQDPDGEALPESATDKQKLDFFFSRFDSEFGHNLKVNANIQGVVADYLQGLPSTISIEFYYQGIEKLMRDWGYINDNSTESQIDFQLSEYWKKLAGSLVMLGRKHGSVLKG